MHLATDVPLLAGLPKIELAKLLSDMAMLQFDQDTVILTPEDSKGSLYFLVAGEVEVSSVEDGVSVPLVVLGPGSLFGEANLLERPQAEQLVKSLTPVRLWRLPVARFQRLLQTHPGLSGELVEMLASRLGGTNHELVRVKRILATYMEEVWSAIPPLPGDEAALAAFPVRPADPPVSVASRAAAHRPETRRALVQTLHMAISVVLAALSLRIPSATPQLSIVIAVTVWAAYNWLTGAIPDYVTALAASTAIAVTGATSPGVAFSGFASSSWLLLLGVLGLGVAVSRSGIIYRFALHMLRMLPPTYVGQSFALAVTGVLFTPVLPSSISRAAIASPLARELSEAMRFPPLGKGSAGLAMSAFLGSGQMYFLFLSGGNICMLAWSLMPATVRSQVTWLSWLWFSLPLGLLTFAGCYAITLLLFPPEPSVRVSHEMVRAQLQVLGPMTRPEKMTLSVLACVLAGFLTQGLHGIDPAWFALPGFLCLVSFGVLDKQSLKEFDWSFLLLIGSVLSLSEVSKATGLSDRMSHLIGPFLLPLSRSPYLFLGGVAVMTLIVRLAIPLQQAVLLMVIALLPIASQAGYNPFVITLVVLALSNTWILPQQNSMYLTVYSATDERCFTHQQVRPLALWQSAIGVLAVLGSVPFWQFIGLLPN